MVIEAFCRVPVVVSTIAVGPDVSWASVNDLVKPSKGYFGYAPTNDKLVEQLTNAFAPFKVSSKPLCLTVEDADGAHRAARRAARAAAARSSSSRLSPRSRPACTRPPRLGQLPAHAHAVQFVVEFVRPDEMPDMRRASLSRCSVELFRYRNAMTMLTR